MSPAYKVVAVVLAAGALAAGGYRAGVGREHDRRLAEVAEIRAAHAATLADIAGKTLASVEAARNLERAWSTAQEASARETATQLARAGRDRAAADAAADGLRRQLADYLRTARRPAAGAGAAPAVAGELGGDALDLFAGLLDRHSRELVEVGGYADKLRVAGQACERDYLALATIHN